MMETTEINNSFGMIVNLITANAVEYEFNLTSIPDLTYLDVNIREESPLKGLFEALDKKTKNCIYWFEVDNIFIGNQIKILLDVNREILKLKGRKVPVHNKNKDSKILYVGVRQGGITLKWNMSNISGRIREHLGYYKVGSTQGLQFGHWARHLDYNVKLKVVEFDDLPNEYLTAIEKLLAFRLKPLFGTH